jgi:hypothetical protein
MGKYVNLEQDVFSVFASPAWLNENIKTFPTNYTAVNSSNEFIRVSVIPSGTGINRASIKGILIIDIFIAAGKGTRRILEIADKLDNYLVNKSITSQSNTQTQFGFSTMGIGAEDKDNRALFKSSYSITFNFFGSQT